MANTQHQTKFLDFDMGRFLPGVDMDSLVASQRRNLDALTQANRVAYEGFQVAARRQMEMMRQAMDDMAQATTDIASPGNAQDKAARQAEMAKGAVERTFTNMRETAEVIARAHTEAFELLNRRLMQGLEEMRDAFQASAAKR